MRRSGVAVLVLGLVPVVSGCSGSTSVEEFCDGYSTYAQAISDLDPDYEGFVDQYRAAARDYADVDVPDEMPDDAVEGREALLAAVEDLDDDDNPFLAADQLDSDDLDKLRSYERYVLETCGGPAGGY